MNNLIKHTCTQAFDPQYGYNAIKAGEIITIRITKDQADCNDIRLVGISDRNSFPGFGCRISEYEYKRYFQAI